VHDEPIPIELVNAVERLQTFRPSVVSNLPPTERAMKLAWILHLVGDIHQPLHASGHVTALPNEKKGDAGGNTFALGPKLSLHSYWDGIVDRADPQKPNESLPNYFDRVANEFETAKPKSTFTILPGKFDKWALESLERAKNKAYPKSLQRNVMPGTTYQQSTFLVAQESIAEGGYRLADLMNQLFGH